MTRLMNVEEDIPKEFYIFVNRLNPLTKHNFDLNGKLVSSAFGSLDAIPEFLPKYLQGTVRYLPYEPCTMDPRMVSPYFVSAINDYRIEYDAEVFRERHYPFLPSRLSAIYAFGDMASCELVARKYRWPIDTVRKFQLVEHPLNRIAKVNMEHVSLARLAYRISMIENTDSIWQAYWTGQGNLPMMLPDINFQPKHHDSEVIWEYLIEGFVQSIP